MEIDWLYQAILLLIFLLLSAFFSDSKVGFFSIKQKIIEDEFKSSKLINHYSNNLLAFPRRLLITNLVGNKVINVAASIVLNPKSISKYNSGEQLFHKGSCDSHHPDRCSNAYHS